MPNMNNYYKVNEIVKFGKAVKFFESKKYGEDESHVVTVNNKFFGYCDESHVEYVTENADTIRLF